MRLERAAEKLFGESRKGIKGSSPPPWQAEGEARKIVLEFIVCATRLRIYI